MYNTDSDKLPKKPVSISQASANEEFARWLAQNDHQHLRDASGMHWNLSVESLEKPDPTDHRQSVWHLNLRISAEVGAHHLIAAKVLDEHQDARLLSFLGDESIRLALKPITHEASGMDAARKWLSSEIQRLRAKFANDAFNEVKRQLVGRWVDESRLFY